MFAKMWLIFDIFAESYVVAETYRLPELHYSYVFVCKTDMAAQFAHLRHRTCFVQELPP